jgi:coenzyme F420-reducing hydrogenase gamma subunit
VVKLASCDGCQLTLLDLEDELLPILGRFDVVEFPEARTTRSEGPYDILFVEGSVSTADQAAEIVALRARTRTLVTIGACATAGGIQALRNAADEPAWRASVYPSPEWISSLATATPIADHVQVDAELRGCPIAPAQLLELLTAIRIGSRPQQPAESLCQACKSPGNVCVLVAYGMPCLGPVTQGGCGALCPSYGRGCYACFGPREEANVAGLRTRLETDRTPPEVDRLFTGFTGWAPPFRESAQRFVAAEEKRRDA